MNTETQPNKRLNRRTLLKRGAGAGALLFTGGAALSLFGERHHPRTRHVTVSLADLPPELEGLRICQLSDLHRNPWVSEAFIRDAVRRANALEADLTVVTGDFLSNGRHFIPSAARALAGLSAPAGVYGVLGNHDHSSGDPEGLRSHLAEAGIQVLVNQSVRLTADGRDWWLCGVDDTRRGAPDLPATLSPVPDGAFRLLLCHEPDYADKAAPYGFSLQLSGHSHGGQIVLPRLGAPILPRGGRKYPSGLQRVAGTGMQVYTNAGIGVVTVPIRLNCPPEITLLTLRRAA